MTSSLVGSEMCIRDRSYAGDDTTRASTPPLHHWTNSRSPRRAMPVGAVSYTHLTLPTICSV
eukprot:2671804-Prorocentrum_lima.AAC.1